MSSNKKNQIFCGKTSLLSLLILLLLKCFARRYLDSYEMPDIPVRIITWNITVKSDLDLNYLRFHY